MGADAVPPHPQQPLVRDADGVVRFRANPAVRYLLDHGGVDLNHLALIHRGWRGAPDGVVFRDEDMAQLAELIGYSVAGYSDLSYVSDRRASAALRKLAALEKGTGHG